MFNADNASRYAMESGSMGYGELLKSLEAGYGTDSALFVDGRSLIREDCETETINVMEQSEDDLKTMRLFKKKDVSSTVHEYNQRLNNDSYKTATAAEGGLSSSSNQNLKRVTREIKYMQQKRSVTDQMLVVDTFENAYATEKTDGILVILKAAEYQNFQGDSSIVSTEYDSMLKQIRDEPKSAIRDARGATLGSLGKAAFNTLAHDILQRGGRATHAFYPTVLGLDVQALIEDQIRYNTGDNKAQAVITSFPTIYGNIDIGVEAGINKFYEVKGEVFTYGDTLKKPNPPTTFASAVGAQTGSKFITTDAGAYEYTVHAINQYGVSTGKVLAAAATVTGGDGVTLTITPDATNGGTGFIICRSAKDGSVVMEMTRVPNSGNATTVYVDLNAELPGTASFVLLTQQKLQNYIQFDQLLPMRVRPLFESDIAEKPFLVQLFGALDMKAPQYNGIYKNIAYDGGLYA